MFDFAKAIEQHKEEQKEKTRIRKRLAFSIGTNNGKKVLFLVRQVFSAKMRRYIVSGTGQPLNREQAHAALDQFYDEAE